MKFYIHIKFAGFKKNRLPTKICTYVCLIIEARFRAIENRPFFRYVLFNKKRSIKRTAMILSLKDWKSKAASKHIPDHIYYLLSYIFPSSRKKKVKMERNLSSIIKHTYVVRVTFKGYKCYWQFGQWLLGFIHNQFQLFRFLGKQYTE